MRVFFERREELAPTVWQYYFKPERPVDFVPGQYANFHLLQPLGDPRGQSRTFSFTSLPSDTFVSFVVKILPSPSPYKQALQALRPGEELRLDDPMGDLVLPKLLSVPLVFLAGGIGIASFASMFKDLLQRREERQLFMFYALRSRGEQIYRELIDSYPVMLKQTVYSPNRLTAQEVTDTTPPDAFIYISGSQRFTEGLQTDLEALGVARERIAFDYFDGYAEL